ncbi:unnamed protein product, partial [Schistosoma curassoni]|uniref:FH2 domain-containing protein n=1 Tax=Schistosoma curassoni TaxID=6186 RepID=A0A183L6T6_9TREM
SVALQFLLKNEEATLEHNRTKIKQTLTSTCQEVLCRNKHRHNECIFMETLFWIQEMMEEEKKRKAKNENKNNKNKKIAIKYNGTRADKFKARVEYTEANKRMEMSIGADWQKFVEELATTVEQSLTG